MFNSFLVSPFSLPFMLVAYEIYRVDILERSTRDCKIFMERNNVAFPAIKYAPGKRFTFYLFHNDDIVCTILGGLEGFKKCMDRLFLGENRMSNLSQKLLRLKERDEQAGRMINRSEGEIKQIKDNMEKRFGVSTISKAETLLKKKRALREKKGISLESDVEVLEAEYVFD